MKRERRRVGERKRRLHETNGKKIRRKKRKRLVACLSLFNALLLCTRASCSMLIPVSIIVVKKKKANPSLRLLFVLSASRQRHGQNFNYALSMSRPAWQNAWTKSSPPGPSGRLGSLQARARPFRQSRQISRRPDMSSKDTRPRALLWKC